MSKSEFLCLAVSRRKKGHYAAGINLSTGEWVRIVGNRNGAELSFGELKVYGLERPRRMKPLDVVSINIGAHVPKPYQPENCILDSKATDGRITFLRNAGEDVNLNQMIRGLAENSNAEELLFGSETSEITSDVAGLKSSLQITSSERLYWRKTGEFNMSRDNRLFGVGPSVKVEFKFGSDQLPYGLPLSDADWENRIRTHLPETGSIEHQLLLGHLGSMQVDTLLTLSFNDDVILDDSQYKFVAGVLLLPKLK